MEQLTANNTNAMLTTKEKGGYPLVKEALPQIKLTHQKESQIKSIC